MNRPNFQTMSKQELRAYVLAHREDNEAFYAFVDRLHESVAATEATVVKWLHFQHPNQTINKIPEISSSLTLTDSEGNPTEIKIQIMGSSLPTHKPFIELLINDTIADTQKKVRKIITIFVSRNESNAKQLETELREANFDSRAQSSLVVGYIEAGKFQSLPGAPIAGVKADYSS
ncbi:hypothetical protein QUB63_34135 [Microcoleus sp. ARI1-B5]|uniref:DUF6887 family protein n=1 Tax=unclassified Microcoleus TaxID=2642155 RepID=UPI002FD1E24F